MSVSNIIKDPNNNIQTPNFLIEATDGKYNSLPLVDEDSRIKKVAIEIFKIILNITLIVPVVLLILSLNPSFTIKFYTRNTMKNLSPAATQRLQERENKIKEIARKAGLSNPDKFKLLIMSDARTPAAAAGTSTLITSPEYLVQPEDLPEELKLERLDKKQISEEEWVVKFNIWLKNSFAPEEIKPFKSQYEVDKMITFGKVWLHQFRNPSIYEINFEAVVGHELGHCYYNHTKGHALVNWGWSLVSIPTLGISSLFTRHFMTPILNKSEKEADIFSAKKIGAQGLINFFSDYREAAKSMHKKYPRRFDANGNNPHDHSHPSLTTRIDYLQKLNRGQA